MAKVFEVGEKKAVKVVGAGTKQRKEVYYDVDGIDSTDGGRVVLSNKNKNGQKRVYCRKIYTSDRGEYAVANEKRTTNGTAVILPV